VDPRGYSCDCPEGMILGDDVSNCIILENETTTRPPASQFDRGS
jgi:hypothetical protein